MYPLVVIRLPVRKQHPRKESRRECNEPPHTCYDGYCKKISDIIDSVDMSLSRLQERVKDREA